MTGVSCYANTGLGGTIRSYLALSFPVNFSPSAYKVPQPLVTFNGGETAYKCGPLQSWCFISSQLPLPPRTLLDGWLPKLSPAGCSKNASSLEY